MTPQQIELIKNSWAKVQPISEKAGELFYGHLFETTPETRAMFKGDIKQQGKNLMATVSVVVKSLDNLENILTAVQTMAVRHVDYGVTEEQYDNVGEALIWTLEQGLGDEFTEEVKEAWVEAYTILSNVMKEAAYEAEPA